MKSSDSVSIQTIVKIIFLVLMALIVFATPILFLIFFVPIAGWFIWRAHDKTVELEKKLAALEKPEEKKPEGS